MKTLSRNDLKQISGGVQENIQCGHWYCVCSGFHGELYDVETCDQNVLIRMGNDICDPQYSTSVDCQIY